MTLTQTLNILAIAYNYEVDSLDDLLFLRAVTKRSGRMVRVVHRG